jgi:anaerobic selenocysteine-containing dehydrogenase
VYFTRVYNPVWTNPDGFSWIEALTDESLVGLHVALTPTWNETAFFADYVLPMGLGSERHDLHSYEQYDGQWVGFRQPVLRAARERSGESIADTREVNPGEVWEENEFWIELSWRIDPNGALGIRRYHESRARPGEKLSVDEYYGWIFEHSVPGLPERAAAEGLEPLAFMRRYGAFEVRKRVGPIHESAVPADELVDTATDRFGRVYTTAPKPAAENLAPVGTPEPDAAGRRPVGVLVDGVVRRGFPTPSGRLEFFSPTLWDWGWHESAVPDYPRSHVHPAALADDEMVLISTFRLPVQIHTRGGNAKWLDEIAHTNPLWIHPVDARRLGLGEGDLVRVETEIGYFVVRTWVTEGIRPGVVACSHHMGRWKLGDVGQRQVMATVALDHQGDEWAMKRTRGGGPFESLDPDTRRIWWTDVGVHQNLTFPVHPDPISGQHCWHQAVRVRRAEPGDAYGDIAVDTARSHDAYRRWLALTRPATGHSPDGTRRPYWLMRPLKPARPQYDLPSDGRRERPEAPDVPARARSGPR